MLFSMFVLSAFRLHKFTQLFRSAQSLTKIYIYNRSFSFSHPATAVQVSVYSRHHAVEPDGKIPAIGQDYLAVVHEYRPVEQDSSKTIDLHDRSGCYSGHLFSVDSIIHGYDAIRQ